MEEEKISQGKTLIVNPINHKTLSLMKIEEEYSSIDDLITILIKEHKLIQEKKQNGKKK